MLGIMTVRAWAQSATINYVYDEGQSKPRLELQTPKEIFNVRDCHEIIPDPEINLYTSYGKLQYDFSRDRSHLTAVGNTFGIIEQGLFAAGLAVVEVSWEVSLNTLSHVLDNGRICVVPSSVEVYIGYQNPVIYVDKSLQAHTCEYNLVVRHEQTHQQINKAALEYFLPMFYRAVGRIARNVVPAGVERINNIDTATAEMTRQYALKLEPLIELFKKELMLEQGKLDNRTNYEMEGQLCRNSSRRQN